MAIRTLITVYSYIGSRYTGVLFISDPNYNTYHSIDELPKHTADGLEIARVEQKVKVEIPFILYLGTVCSIILLAIVVYIYVAIKL